MKVPNNNFNYTFVITSLSAMYIACHVFQGLVSVKGLLNKVPDYRLWFPLKNHGTWGDRDVSYLLLMKVAQLKKLEKHSECKTPYAVLTIKSRWGK